MKKRLGAGAYITVLSALLGVAGLILTVMSNSVSRDNVLLGQNIIMAAGVCGIVCTVAAVAFGYRFGNHHIVSALLILVSIAVYCYVFGQCILQRVTLIAGLYSFNSGNKVGWKIFYMTIALFICYFISILAMIVGSFMNTVSVKPCEESINDEES